MQHGKGHPENAPRMVRAAEVRGTKVVNLKNEDLGKITDLIVDVRRGFTPYAVVSFGGVLGIARDSVSVPLGTFARTEDEKKFVLQTTREQLESAPDFDPRNWDSLHDETWRDKIARAFGQAPEKHGDITTPQSTLPPYILASNLDGASVSDSQREHSGSIADLILDRYSGELGFILLKSGGVAGIGGYTVPVPWNALHRIDTTEFQIPITRNRLEEAPRLERDDVAILADPSLCDSVCSFYGVTSRTSGAARPPAVSSPAPPTH